MSEVELREYIERMIRYERQWVEAQLAAMDKALTKAETAMSMRLEGMNEFRRQLEQQEKRYAQTSDLQSAVEKIDIRLETLRNRVISLEKAESIMTGKTAMLWLFVVIALAFIGAGVKWL